MAGNYSELPVTSSTDNLLDESGDPTAIYWNYQNVVNNTQKKLVEMNDTVSALNCHIASTSLAAVTLFDPKIHLRLHQVETQGHQMDRLVAATQEMKKQLSDLAGEANKNNPVGYYRAQLERLGLLDPMMDTNKQPSNEQQSAE